MNIDLIPVVKIEKSATALLNNLTHGIYKGFY
jgi:hypothetical protein